MPHFEVLYSQRGGRGCLLWDILSFVLVSRWYSCRYLSHHKTRHTCRAGTHFSSHLSKIVYCWPEIVLAPRPISFCTLSGFTPSPSFTAPFSILICNLAFLGIILHLSLLVVIDVLVVELKPLICGQILCDLHFIHFCSSISPPPLSLGAARGF